MNALNDSSYSDLTNFSSYFNKYGESPLPNAPMVNVGLGCHAVPSQYLQFFRTQENVENIISEINFKANFPIFVGTRNSKIYLQVGIIGFENYPRDQQNANKQKIVYGRSWYIESTAPTSEVVQTACLALKKAREHELREKLSLSLNAGANRATPFNSHIDAVLMAKMTKNSMSYSGKETSSLENFIQSLFKRLRLNKLSFELLNIQRHQFDQAIVDIALSESNDESLFPDFSGLQFSLFCQYNSRAAFLHELMARLIYLSDRYVDENFSFKGFKRFSYQNCPQAIAKFSLNTRLFDYENKEFWQRFEEMTYQVDSARVPSISNSLLGKKIRKSLAKFDDLTGYLPTIVPS